MHQRREKHLVLIKMHFFHLHFWKTKLLHSSSHHFNSVLLITCSVLIMEQIGLREEGIHLKTIFLRYPFLHPYLEIDHLHYQLHQFQVMVKISSLVTRIDVS